MIENLTPEQEQTRALLAPILNPGQSVGLMLGRLALYTDATPPEGSEDPLDYAPTYIELEGSAADWQSVAELFQTVAEYHAALAPAPATGSGAEAGVLDTTFECDLGDVTMREYFAALLTGLLEEEEMFSPKRPFGNSGWKWELYYALLKAGLIEGEEDEIGFDVDATQQMKGDGLLLAFVREALSLPLAPAPAGAE